MQDMGIKNIFDGKKQIFLKCLCQMEKINQKVEFMLVKQNKKQADD